MHDGTPHRVLLGLLCRHRLRRTQVGVKSLRQVAESSQKEAVVNLEVLEAGLDLSGQRLDQLRRFLCDHVLGEKGGTL